MRDDLTAQTTAARELFTSIQTRLRVLEQGNANLRVLIPAGQSLYNLSLQDVDVREQQVGLVKGRFKEVIHRYAETEREHRAKQRLRLERQIKVVNPSLPPEEVQDLVNRAEDGESGAIFAQAVSCGATFSLAVCLLSGARYGLHERSKPQRLTRYAFADYGLSQPGGSRCPPRGSESRCRARADRANAHRTRAALSRCTFHARLSDLYQVRWLTSNAPVDFPQMAIMVEAQDVVIAEVEQTAAIVSHDMEKGVEQVQVAVKHARNARKFRWICFGLLVLILVSSSFTGPPKTPALATSPAFGYKSETNNIVLGQVILAIVLCATLIPPALRARNNNNNNTAPPPSPSASTA